MSSFQHKNVLITGGSTGIGLATAEAFINQGANVIITGTSEQNLQAAAARINSKNLQTVKSNTADLGAIDQLLKAIKGGIDVLFINAGIGQFAPVEQTSEDTFDSIMDINFKGAYFTLQKTSPFINEGGSVILLSSINANVAMPNTSVYGASKAALNALGRVAAAELATRKIRLNIVSPGPVETPIFKKLGLPEDSLKEFAETMSNKVPLKRFGKPEEIASLVLFLSNAEWITGSEFVIDGGLSLHQV